MSHSLNKLSATEVKGTKWIDKDRKISDGGGLYLHVTKSGKYWRMKFRYANKENVYSIGVYPLISLAEARKKRDAAKRLLADNINPNTHKKTSRVESSINTFKAIALEWWKDKCCHEVTKGHAENNLRRLELEIFPYIGEMPIKNVTPLILLDCLKRIEKRGHIETAHRVKGICGKVFRYAIVTGRAERDPSQDLKDALKTPKVKHHPAIIEPKEVGGLLRAIDGYIGSRVGKAALQLLPLVFVRPGELRGAKWAEIDLETAEWRFIASKTNQPHIVPLSSQAISILQELKPLTEKSEYIFPSERTREKPISNNTINAGLRRLGFTKDEMTGHGFRAIARTLLVEELNQPVEWVEMQLAHAVKDVHGTAYNRTTFIEKRRKMMQTWADYLDHLKRAENE